MNGAKALARRFRITTQTSALTQELFRLRSVIFGGHDLRKPANSDAEIMCMLTISTCGRSFCIAWSSHTNATHVQYFRRALALIFCVTRLPRSMKTFPFCAPWNQHNEVSSQFKRIILRVSGTHLLQ